MKYRKKPVVIETIQYTGDNAEECIALQIGTPRPVWDKGDHLIIGTLEGNHRADVGDWIIKGVKGELYPCKPDIFDMTYEKVE